MKKNLHIIFRENKWFVVREGTRTVVKTFKSKPNAMSFAYHDTLKNDACIFEHDEHGKIKTVKCPKKEIPRVLKIFRLKFGLDEDKRR